MKELKIIAVGKTHYLGKVKDGKIVDALDCQESVESNDLRLWLAAENVGDLETVTLSSNQGFTEKPLNKELCRNLAAYIAEFDAIKETALQVLQNEQFEAAHNQ